MNAIRLKVSSRGYVVLPAKLRKKMKITSGTNMLITTEDDKIILQPLQSFTRKLSGMARGVYGKSRQEIETYIDAERKTR